MNVDDARRYIIGMDIGSTTVKAVVWDDRLDRVVWQDYQRHETRIAEKTREFLQRIEHTIELSDDNACIFLTGSGGRDMAEVLGGHFVHEVNAVALAVEKLYPDAYSVIELGGQDSKIIVFKDQTSESSRKKIATMNDKCAGGTGAVIDKISVKLSIPAESLHSYRYRDVRIHRVAGKCGVFAETDINSLQKQGIPAEELIASLFEAIVLQNLTVLTRGHTLHPKVLLLGGPNRFIKGLQEAWQTHLPYMWAERGLSVSEDADPEDLIFAPDNGQYFGALGAVEYGREHVHDAKAYGGHAPLEMFGRNGDGDRRSRYAVPALAASGEDLSVFLERYAQKPFSASPLESGAVLPAFLGVDGGSTSTKAVLVGEDGHVLAKAYSLSRGNPIEDVIGVVRELRETIESHGANVEVLGAATTGYAKDILGRVLGADMALVETVAHARSAQFFYERPDVIVDVGGQDIKLIIMKDGHVKDFMLNTQCSAGNGYFLQSTAESLGIPIDTYAETAFRASQMPEFSYGCAVFLQSDIVDYQRQGWESEELLAGLASVLPKNIWLYVAKVANLAALGRRFILQGGTQRNLAAVKAQVDYIQDQFRSCDVKPEIIVHEHCGEAGAIGAALEARRLWASGRRTQFIGLEAVDRIRYRTTAGAETICRFCKNSCVRTFIDFLIERPSSDETGSGTEWKDRPETERFIVATCEKGAAEDKTELHSVVSALRETKKKNPNLVDVAARGVWKSFQPPLVSDSTPARAWSPTAKKRVALMRRRAEIRIGIPRVLGMYQHAPLFTAYLESLGVQKKNIVFSDFTTDSMYREGTRRGAIDPCFPAKVVMSHIHNLLERSVREKLDIIFCPMLDSHDSEIVNTKAHNACATVIATPQTVRAMFIKEVDVFAQHGVDYMYPLLDVSNREMLTWQMFQAWRDVMGLGKEENRRAVDEGFKALRHWKSTIRRQGREIIDTLEREQRLGIVMLGRSYHHDPGLNHGILEEFQKLGYPILSQDTLPVDDDLVDKLFGDEVRDGVISHPLDITDVWKHPYIASTAMKLWAAKFVARHPNLIAIEVANFKCGHDAPIHQVVERIIECAGRPFFSFKDLDENRPSGTFKVRIETIQYFLERYRQRLLGGHPRRTGGGTYEVAAER